MSEAKEAAELFARYGNVCGDADKLLDSEPPSDSKLKEARYQAYRRVEQAYAVMCQHFGIEASPSILDAELTALRQRLEEAERERDGWHRQHDMVLAQARKDNLRAEQADQYEQWLLDLGKLSGCEHLDDRLPQCIEEAFTTAQDEAKRLRGELAALRAERASELTEEERA